MVLQRLRRYIDSLFAQSSQEVTLSEVMYDAVGWGNIPDTAYAVAGYDDGAVSKWPAEAWAKFDGTRQLHITTTGSADSDTVDVERFDVSPMTAATIALQRKNQGKWTVIYSGENNINAVVSALATKSLRFSPASSFPAPGAYLWAANPTGEIHSEVPWAPVQPVAVQSLQANGCDQSWVAPNFPPAPVAAPKPAPAPVPQQDRSFTLNMPILSAVTPGPNVVDETVRCLQCLLNMRHGAGLVIDGRFGPRTAAAVTAWEEANRLTVDSGIAGPQVWTSLLAV